MEITERTLQDIEDGLARDIALGVHALLPKVFALAEYAITPLSTSDEGVWTLPTIQSSTASIIKTVISAHSRASRGGARAELEEVKTETAAQTRELMERVARQRQDAIRGKV